MHEIALEEAGVGRLKSFVKFIQAAGIPSIIEGNKKNIDLAELAEIAAYNKVQPFWAQSLDSGKDRSDRYNQFLSVLACIGESLSDLDYSIIKTLRPVPHIPSDVDILVEPSEFFEAYRRLVLQNFEVLDKCPFGATLYDTKTGFNADLSSELTVVGMKYIDRDLILSNTIEHEVCNTKIKVPNPSVDLLVVIDHSVFKEGIYTLRDFYTIMPWLQYLPRTIDLAFRESDALAMRLFLATTYLILKESLGEEHVTTKQLADILVKVPTGSIPTLPYKYKLIEVADSFVSKGSYFLKGKGFEGLIANSMSTKTLRLFVNYLRRKAY